MRYKVVWARMLDNRQAKRTHASDIPHQSSSRQLKNFTRLKLERPFYSEMHTQKG